MTTRRKKVNRGDHMQLAVVVFTEVLLALAVDKTTLVEARQKLHELVAGVPEGERAEVRAALQMMIGRVRSSIPSLAGYVAEAGYTAGV